MFLFTNYSNFCCKCIQVCLLLFFYQCFCFGIHVYVLVSILVRKDMDVNGHKRLFNINYTETYIQVKKQHFY